MNAGTMSLRSRLALLRTQLRAYEADLESQRLHIRIAALEEVGGDPKLLGANEQARDDAYRLRYALSEQCRRLQAGADAARAEIERLTADLEDAVDEFRRERMEAQIRLADALLALASAGEGRLTILTTPAIEEAVSR